MEYQDIIFLLSMATVGLGVTSFGLLVAWIRARGRAIRAETRLEALGGRPVPATVRATDDRMERLEQAVESIAVDVERIAEAERFASKLLAERVPAERKRAEGGRVITPH